MAFVADMIVAGAKRSRGWADKLLVGVTPELFARKPQLERGGRSFVVDTNHPAFVLGHLGLYPARIFQLFGRDGSGIGAPAGFEDLFKNGSPCQDDAGGSIYPRMEAIVSQYTRSYDAAIEMVSKLDDRALDVPIPDPLERFRASFPSAGAVAMFLLNNHQMMHLGQVSAWRRCMGLGPA